MTSCTEFELLISEKLDGEISEQDMALLEAHLKICPHCQILYRDLSQLKEDLSADWITPPAHLHDKVMHAIRTSDATIKKPKQSNKKKRSILLSFAAMLAIILTGVITLYPTLEQPSSLEPRSMREFDTPLAQKEYGASFDASIEEAEMAPFIAEDKMTPFTANASPLPIEEAETLLFDYLSKDGTITYLSSTDDGAYYLFSFTDAFGDITEYAIHIFTRDISLAKDIAN